MNLTLADLPKVKGKLLFRQPLAPYTWFRVGGFADAFFMPVDCEDLQSFLQNVDADIPVIVIGACSNVIIRDRGIKGVVVRLVGKYWGEMSLNGELGINARAGALDTKVARFAATQGITGLEFFSGIPGTIGAAVHTNAGCYGREFKDVVKEIIAVDRSGEIVSFTPTPTIAGQRNVRLNYRSSNFPSDIIVLSVILEGSGKSDTRSIVMRINALRERRQRSQPIREKTGGSTFANPGNGQKAWELIERAGCRGMRIGEAQVSEKHCNFITNKGGASADDIEELGIRVQQNVFERTGISLRWEIKRIGRSIDEVSRD